MAFKCFTCFTYKTTQVTTWQDTDSFWKNSSKSWHWSIGHFCNWTIVYIIYIYKRNLARSEPPYFSNIFPEKMKHRVLWTRLAGRCEALAFLYASHGHVSWRRFIATTFWYWSQGRILLHWSKCHFLHWYLEISASGREIACACGISSKARGYNGWEGTTKDPCLLTRFLDFL